MSLGDKNYVIRLLTSDTSGKLFIQTILLYDSTGVFVISQTAKTITGKDFNPHIQPYLPHNTYWRTLNLSGLSLDENAVDLRNLTRLLSLDMQG